MICGILMANNIFQEGFEDAWFCIGETFGLGINILEYLGHWKQLKQWEWMQLTSKVSGYRQEGVGPRNRVRL